MPTEVRVWRCDICHDDHETEQMAVSCEAKGREAVPPWLRPGGPVFGFGEHGVVGRNGVGSGVQYAALVQRIEEGHEVLVGLDVYLRISRHQGHVLPLRALDPTRGWDFLRSVGADQIEDQVRQWIGACAVYGLDTNMALDSLLAHHTHNGTTALYSTNLAEFVRLARAILTAPKEAT
jgi:hypothetical protein